MRVILYLSHFKYSTFRLLSCEHWASNTNKGFKVMWRGQFILKKYIFFFFSYLLSPKRPSRCWWPPPPSPCCIRCQRWAPAHQWWSPPGQLSSANSCACSGLPRWWRESRRCWSWWRELRRCSRASWWILARGRWWRPGGHHRPQLPSSAGCGHGSSYVLFFSIWERV